MRATVPAAYLLRGFLFWVNRERSTTDGYGFRPQVILAFKNLFSNFLLFPRKNRLKEQTALHLSTKPLMNVLWLGTVLLTRGAIVALKRSYRVFLFKDSDSLARQWLAVFFGLSFGALFSLHSQPCHFLLNTNRKCRSLSVCLRKPQILRSCYTLIVQQTKLCTTSL